MEKVCPICKTKFSKPYNESKRDWENRHIYCSRPCSNIAKKGRVPHNKGQKGLQKWTKGQHEVMDGRFKGEKSTVWKGGRWRHYGRQVAFSNLPHYCDMCKAANVPFQVHHKDKDIHHNTPDNLQLLCAPCHQRHHKLGVRASPATEFKPGFTPRNKKDIDMSAAVEYRKQGLSYKAVGIKVGLSKPSMMRRLKELGL